MIRSSYAAVARCAGAVLVAVLACAAMASSASAAVASITSSAGPLTEIHTSDRLNCQIKRAGDANYQFFPSDKYETGNCGTFLWAGGAKSTQNTYGPTAIGYGFLGWTPVSQSPVSGTGTASDPYRVTTVVAAGTTGLRVSQTESYVLGDESYRSSITVTNSGATPVDAVLYHAADCYLQTSDSSFGFYDSTSKGSYCSLSANNSPASRIEGFAPVEPGSHYLEADYDTLWRAVSGNNFPDTCACASNIDSATGISWSITVPAGGSVTRTVISGFSPNGTAIAAEASPLSVTPTGPANNNNPIVKGTADAGTTVKLYTNATCTSPVAGSGTAAAFASPGLSVSVGDNTTTTFYATSTTTSNATTSCSRASVTYVEDSTGPSVTLSSTSASVTNASPIPVEIKFSEPVTGLVTGDLNVIGGTVHSLTGSGDTYTFSITPSGDGQVIVNLPADVAADAAGNGNTAATQLARYSDTTRPNVNISSSAPEPTNTSPIPFTASFDSSVVGFNAADVSVSGGTVSGFSGSGTTYTFNVIPSGEGAVSVSVGENVAADPAGNGNTAGAAVTRTYSTAPVANNDSYETDEDAPLTVDAAHGLYANDVNANGVQLSFVTDPAHGLIDLYADGSFTYTPGANFHGTDSFTYSIDNGTSAPSQAVVTITVNAVNHAPVAVADAGGSTDEDTPLSVGAAQGVLANDSDPDGDSIIAVLDAFPEHGFVSIGQDGSWTYTPEQDFHGSDSFRYYAYDGDVQSNVVTVPITVNPVNDAPVASTVFATVAEDSTGNPLTLDVSDPDGDTQLTPEVTQEPAHGTTSVVGGVLKYTPAANYSGPDVLNYRVNDGSLDSNEASVVITVSGSNDAPVAVDDAISVDEDGSATLLTGGATSVLANDTDAEGDALTAAVDEEPSHGTLTLNPNGTFSYAPEADYDGTDSFTYKAHDGTVASAPATVSITVNGVDDAPVAVDDSVTVDEDSGASALDLLGNDTDIDGGPLAVASVTDAAHGAVVLTQGRGGGVTYSPDADYCGPDSFTYKVNGGSEATVSLTVTCVDGPTSTKVTSSKNPAVAGDAVTLTATVSADAGGAANGKVTFKDGATSLGTVDLDGNGVATVTKSDLAVGDHAIAVEYAGTNDLRPSSGSLAQKVEAAPVNNGGGGTTDGGGGGTAGTPNTPGAPNTPAGPNEPTTPVVPVVRTGIAISHRTVPRSGEYVKLAIKCRAAVGKRCVGELLLDPASGSSRTAAAAAAKGRYGVVRFDVAAGKTKTVKLEATPKLLAALKKRLKVIAKATAVFEGVDGAPVTVERKLTIVEPKKKASRK